MRKIKNIFPAETVSGSCKLDLKLMLRDKCIVRNRNTYGILEWTGGQNVVFDCIMTRERKYIRLQYTVTIRREIKHLDYKIFFDEIESNLGKGSILYFICPESGRRSRILYQAYGESKFLNRKHYEEKYGLRIYYGCQKSSKIDYHNTRYFDLKREIDRLEYELNQKHRNSHYRGHMTNDQHRLLELRIKQGYHNRKRIEDLKL